MLLGGKFTAINMAAFSQKRVVKKRFHFLLSSFTSEEKTKLSRWIQNLGGTYYESPHFVRSCTHVICGKPSRGEKFLCGCASGKWILRREFIEDSIKAGKWLDEELYEWNEQCPAEGIAASHLSSPSRWKSILQQNRGPFDGWKALVAVADSKKRAAYKKLLEVGCAALVSGKPPYPACLASKLTHVFVEKALENDVQALQSAGVKCLSPDYIPEFILQDPPPPVEAFFITNYSSPVTNPTTERLQRTVARSKNTPVLGRATAKVTGHIQCRVGKENDSSISTSKKLKANDSVILNSKRSKAFPCVGTENGNVSTSPGVGKENDPVLTSKKSKASFSTGKENGSMVTSKKSKASSELLCTSESPNKKQKLDDKVEGFSNCVDRWRAVSSLYAGSYTNKVCDRGEFPGYIGDSIEGYLEESHKYTVLDVIGSFMTSQRYPSPTLLHTITHNLLLKSQSRPQTIKAFVLLQRLLLLHNPSQNPTLYRATVGSEDGDSWDFMKTICSNKDENSLLVLRFVISLLEQDFYERIKSCVSATPSEKLNCLKESLLWRMFWPGPSSVSFNTRLRELFGVTWSAACSSRDNPSQIPALYALQSVVAMAAECFVLCDLVSMKCTEKNLGTRLSERSRTFVTELFLACGRQHGSEVSLKRFLETCTPTWLRMHVTDMLLANYVDRLVPLERRHVNSSALSLEKIVSSYFFLLPAATTSFTEDNVVKSADVKTTRRKGTPLQAIGPVNQSRKQIHRRNIKGETDLQLSCIRNDVVKVKQLLAIGADANMKDFAGWTALHEACNHGYADCVQELLKARQLVYDIKPVDDTTEVLNLLSAPVCGTTPLHDAVGNNHQQVVELLVRAGGLPLLEAKNDQGERPIDLAAKNEIKEFLRTMELRLREKENTVTALRPSEESYQAVLGRKGRHSTNHIPAEKCEQYLLILSHLVQAYFRSTRGRANFASDDCVWMNFDEHCNNLEAHVTRIIAASRLSSLACIRIQAMRMLATS